MISSSRDLQADYPSRDRDRYRQAWPSIRRYGYPPPRTTVADRVDQLEAILGKLIERVNDLELRAAPGSDAADLAVERAELLAS